MTAMLLLGPYVDNDAGPSLSVAPEVALGEKKPQPSPCRNCGRYWRSSYPCGPIRLQACWSWSRGYRSAITRRIERIERVGKRTDRALDGEVTIMATTAPAAS